MPDRNKVLIEARHVSKSYGRCRAVRDLSFAVDRGSVTALLGVNGAGKTTTMRLLTGALHPDHGTIVIAGHCSRREARAARRATGYLPEAVAGFDHLTADELLTFVAEVRGFTGHSTRQEIDRVVDLIGLREVRFEGLATLSKGWRQRAWLAQALVGDPPVLVLDEPTDGLDPDQKVRLRQLLRALAADKAILMSTHILEEAEELCDRVIIMSEGASVADAPIATLLDARGRLQTAFTRLTAAAREPA